MTFVDLASRKAQRGSTPSFDMWGAVEVALELPACTSQAVVGEQGRVCRTSSLCGVVVAALVLAAGHPTCTESGRVANG